MTDEELQYERLMETFQLERLEVAAYKPPYWGGFVGNPKWWKNDMYMQMPAHLRTSGPVANGDIIYVNKEGKKHRLYGPAHVSRTYDFEIWYKEDRFHRIGGPAIKHGGNFVWMQEDRLHNLYGPAIINGGQPPKYFIDGRKYSPKEYKKEIARMRKRGLIRD